MNDKRKSRGMNIGITTITVVFIIICMTIFAVLSLTTARQEEKFANKYAVSVENYYNADYQCATVANDFGEMLRKGAKPESLEELAEEYAVLYSETEDGISVSYSCMIDDKNAICVTLKLGQEVTIEQWQQVYVGEWEPDFSINVWQG